VLVATLALRTTSVSGRTAADIASAGVTPPRWVLITANVVLVALIILLVLYVAAFQN
jgi:hypothetical protein